MGYEPLLISRLWDMGPYLGVEDGSKYDTKLFFLLPYLGYLCACNIGARPEVTYRYDTRVLEYETRMVIRDDDFQL